MTRSATTRRLTAALLAAGLAVQACSSGTADAPASGAFTVWDPYPQFDAGSEWVGVLDRCGARAGVTIERQAYDTTDLTNKVLLAAQQGAAPDVLVVDNPVVSTLAEGGVLAPNEDTGLRTSSVTPNLVAAGRSGERTYGVPIGANTLALYYNEAVLTAAGVDPASVTDWASLDAALARVVAAGKKGITFSAIGTEEGTFQFLPWLWGAGAELTDLASPDATAALELWKSWLDKGYAPNSVINNTQTTSWQEFATGEYAFAENGTWQLGNADKAGFEYGVIPVPARDGDVAPAPTGGEFVTVPVQGDADAEAKAAKIAECLTSPKTVFDTDKALTYVSAVPSVQQRQISAAPDFAVWVDAVNAAKGRTSDGLGTRYPRISEQLWKAVQVALTGSKSPGEALTDAQAAAQKAK